MKREHTLLTIAINAPWCGVVRRQRRRPRVLHAITMEAAVKGWENGDFRKRQARFESACGETGVAMIGQEDPWLWPPRVVGMPKSVVRCRKCHEATGRKRPRMWFEKRASGFSKEQEA